MPSFYNGKRFFLTYPQCDAEPQQLVDFLSGRAPLSYYVVCRELHADGNPHLHACVEFKTTQRQSVNWLDFVEKHPNKQDPRNWAACKTYVKKDGDFLEIPDTSDSEISKVDIKKICIDTSCQADWMVFCVGKRIPFPYACWLWNTYHSDIYTLTDDVHTGDMCASLKEFKFDPQLHKCIILKGASGCGKTTWAKINMPKPCLFISHVDQLKQFDVGRHKSIIFDDVDIRHYPVTSQIHFVDFENTRALHCRHSVAVIPAGIFKVFTCNEEPINMSDAAIRRRVRVYNVVEK